MPAPGLGRPQCQVIKQPIRPAQCWEVTPIAAEIAGEAAHRDAHSRSQDDERSPVSDAPFAKIHEIDLITRRDRPALAYAVTLKLLGDVGLDKLRGGDVAVASAAVTHP